MRSWAVALTTVPARRQDLLPRTLASLRAAGWSELRLFVDGCTHAEAASFEQEFGLPVTARYPKVRPYGSWVLALIETYIRESTADMYLVSQDDVAYCRNVRAYLDQSELPPQAYLNLISFMQNHRIIHDKPPGTWHEASLLNPGDPKRWQTGRGAVALAFSRAAVLTLLANQQAAAHLADRPQDPARGWRYIDGGVVEAMNRAGWREYVHAPSLTQHIGENSTFDKNRASRGTEAHHPIWQWPKDRIAHSFRGETFDALDLLK